MAAKDTILIMTTVPTKEIALAISHDLIQTTAIVACVNIIPNIESIYLWKNEVVTDREFLLLIKAPRKNEKRIYEEILAKHPYDIPEIISLDIAKGHDDYINWILGVRTP